MSDEERLVAEWRRLRVEYGEDTSPRGRPVLTVTRMVQLMEKRLKRVRREKEAEERSERHRQQHLATLVCAECEGRPKGDSTQGWTWRLSRSGEQSNHCPDCTGLQ